MGGLSFPPVLPQDRWGASTGARPRSKLRGGSLERRRYGSCAMRPGTDIRCFKRRLGRARSELARSRMRSPQPPQHAHRVPSQLCGAMCHSRNSASSITAEKGAMHQSQCQHPNCPHWSNGSRSMVALERSPSLACRRRAHHLTTHAISIRHSISNAETFAKFKI